MAIEIHHWATPMGYDRVAFHLKMRHSCCPPILFDLLKPSSVHHLRLTVAFRIISDTI